MQESNQPQIVAIVRTKGPAPYLKQVIKQFVEQKVRVFVLDNNASAKWQGIVNDLVEYQHDPTDYIPMCSDDFVRYCHGQDRSICIAAMYNEAFKQSRYPGSWLLKLDDDDLWTEGAIERLKATVNSTVPSGVIYFSGVNLLNNSTISKKHTFCGGRDHFCIGPNVKLSFKNGIQWEEAIFEKVKKVRFLGLSYAHLKFFGASTGYDKDKCTSSDRYLSELEAEVRGARQLTYLRSNILRLLASVSKPYWRLLENNQLGMINAYVFYNELRKSNLLKGNEQ